MVSELPIEKLRRMCEIEELGYDTSQHSQRFDTIIGQERAVRALRFGMGIKETGFNIFVSGLPGTGRTTAVEHFLEQVAQDQPIPDDWCYVNNFRDPYRPKALRLPAGRAQLLQEDLQRLVETARQELQTVFDSEEYAAKKEEIVKSFQQRREDLLEQMSERAQQEGFVIQFSPLGLLTVPLKDGEPIDQEGFLDLGADEREEITRKQQSLQSELEVIMRRGKGLGKTVSEELKKLDQDVAQYALSHLMEELQEAYHDIPEILSHLDEVQKDILSNLSDFREEPRDERTPALAVRASRPDPFRKYRVNVLVDNSELEGAPVVIELNPIYNNLFGRVDQEAQFGALTTDFTLIREGSLHRANGGYLVIPAEDLLRAPFAWDSLKRALQNKQILIEDAGERLGFISTRNLRPEPIPLDAKVILIGQPDLYYLLHTFDKDLNELFKVKADFDTHMDRTSENIQNYTAFVCTVCDAEGLLHLDNSALAKIVEHGSRLAEDQEKLSTRFGEVADVIREASFYAAQENAQKVTATHVERAIQERFYRSSLLHDRIQEMIERDEVMIDVTGEQVGQVNGLSVIDLGDIAFGRPNRITASVGLGGGGLVDIEREAKLGGPIHTKGVMILTGYLTEKYAQDKPLRLTARLVFEQSYSGVEGDSASSTELYALLSSLSGLPIKQAIAVTGSVNQKGEIQPIGGANEKIEGFFETCKAKGLTGEQGVIIPIQNVTNLMLKPAVLEAVENKQFHIWPVQTIDEGIRILTGVPAGNRGQDGAFEAESVNDRVDKRLRKMAETMQSFAETSEKESADKP